MSPVESESRIAAQLAPLLIVELIPYFLNNPFSCAMISGEQSVSAIMPNLRSATSGASLAGTAPITSGGTAGLEVSFEPPQPLTTANDETPSAAAPARNIRRVVRAESGRGMNHL